MLRTGGCGVALDALPATTRSRSARLTIPINRSSFNTGTRLIRCAASNCATSVRSVVSMTVMTGAVMTPPAE